VLDPSDAESAEAGLLLGPVVDDAPMLEDATKEDAVVVDDVVVDDVAVEEVAPDEVVEEVPADEEVVVVSAGMQV